MMYIAALDYELPPKRTSDIVNHTRAPDDNRPCPFCNIHNDELMIERPLAYLRRDHHPLTKGHSLVIPKRHIATLFETTKDERLQMMELLDEAKALLDANHGPDGYNIGINSGRAAGQTVMHLHMHVIPRYAGDTSDPRGGIRLIFPERAEYWKTKT